MKYFLQVELYKVEEQKLRVSNVLGKIEVQYSSEISGRKKRMSMHDVISNC